jgi:hypothetical protein
VPKSRGRARKVTRARSSSQARALAKAHAANRRGWRVKPVVADFERVSKLGERHLVEALIARHTLRMERISALPESYTSAVLTVLAPLTLIDKSLRRLGALTDRHPADFSGGAPDHYAWACDSVIACARLLLCGQLPGAAVIARHQLERWTLHRAFNWSITQEPGEPTMNFIARVWSTPQQLSPMVRPKFDSFETESMTDELEGAVTHDEPESDHLHVPLTDGREICPAVVYGYLSELLHGRQFSAAIRWSAGQLVEADGGVEPQAYGVVDLITDALALCTRQLRIGVLSLAQSTNSIPGRGALALIGDTFSEATAEEGLAPPPINSPERQLAKPPLSAVMPLLPEEGLSRGPMGVVREGAYSFDSILAGWKPNGNYLRDDELVCFNFMWHRYASATFALKAMRLEKERLGEDFDEASLGGRAGQWVFLTEAATLVGRWVTNEHVGNALSLIGSGLRSAYWLWLEDDDRSMSVQRSVLEQTSRSRAWRLKPTKAAELENRWQTTPPDWLEAAGWRRLTALNRALGEFAHVKATSRWHGARELLSELQLNVDSESAIYTARGASLDFVSLLVAKEVLAWCEELSPTIANTLQAVFASAHLSDGEESLEFRMNHIWRHRADDMGQPIFVEARRPEQK